MALTHNSLLSKLLIRGHNVSVVKSAIHFLADFEPIAETVLFAVAAGQNPCKLTEIPYKKLRSGLRLGAQGPAFIRPEH